MVDILAGEVEDTITAKKKNPTLKGRPGGLKGGKARAIVMTDEQRADVARTAAQARWKKRT